MHLEEITNKTKKGATITWLLRRTYREDGKVKKQTIANLSTCSLNEIQALKFALSNKDNLDVFLKPNMEGVSIIPSYSVGAVATIYQVAKRLGIEKALGTSREGKLALWQVMARVLEQGSRLSSIRAINHHAGLEILGLDSDFNEDTLYQNLAWVSDNQQRIEKNLFKNEDALKNETVFLYDVSSSYFEGQQNHYAKYGYNRDKKRGKKQVVYGLLTNSVGEPIAIKIFEGNTSDVTTVKPLVDALKKDFKVKNVTLVGDRGMIKTNQKKILKEAGFKYITALTKVQVEVLIKNSVIQYSLFDQDLHEAFEEDSNKRYVVRKNSIRANEIQLNRTGKLATLNQYVSLINKYLKDKKKSKLESALKKVIAKRTALKISWVTISSSSVDKTISVSIDELKLAEISKLDGCYCLETDLSKEVSKDTVHTGYKSLQSVEQDFRTFKQVFLDVRPIFVRTAKSTEGHFLITMLACKIVRELRKVWQPVNLKIQEALELLAQINLCSIQIKKASISKISSPNEIQLELLTLAKVILPDVLPARDKDVVSRKHLSDYRKK
jgi:transposase